MIDAMKRFRVPSLRERSRVVERSLDRMSAGSRSLKSPEQPLSDAETMSQRSSMSNYNEGSMVASSPRLKSAPRDSTDGGHGTGYGQKEEHEWKSQSAFQLNESSKPNSTSDYHVRLALTMII